MCDITAIKLGMKEALVLIYQTNPTRRPTPCEVAAGLNNGLQASIAAGIRATLRVTPLMHGFPCEVPELLDDPLFQVGSFDSCSRCSNQLVCLSNAHEDIPGFRLPSGYFVVVEVTAAHTELFSFLIGR